MSILELIWPFFFPLVAAVIALIHIRTKNHHGTQALEIFLMWQIGVGLGLEYVYAGLGHLLFADQIAQSIGWPAGNPFQREVGIWDAAMGFIGLLCLKVRDEGFWTATVLGTGIFSAGAGLGHVYELVVNGNNAPNNAGPVMYLDLLYPVFLVALLYLLHRKRREDGTGAVGIHLPVRQVSFLQGGSDYLFPVRRIPVLCTLFHRIFCCFIFFLSPREVKIINPTPPSPAPFFTGFSCR